MAVHLTDANSPRAKLALLSLYNNGGTTPRRIADELVDPLLTTLVIADILLGHCRVEPDDGQTIFTTD